MIPSKAYKYDKAPVRSAAPVSRITLENPFKGENGFVAFVRVWLRTNGMVAFPFKKSCHLILQKTKQLDSRCKWHIMFHELSVNRGWMLGFRV